MLELLGLGEWLAWVGFSWFFILWYNRVLLWLWFLTAEMQRKIDERDDL
jgi:hypothetical protein